MISLVSISTRQWSLSQPLYLGPTSHLVIRQNVVLERFNPVESMEHLLMRSVTSTLTYLAMTRASSGGAPRTPVAARMSDRFFRVL